MLWFVILVLGLVMSLFGFCWGCMYEGIDIGVSYGLVIHVVVGGMVIYCGWEFGYGNLIVIEVFYVKV